MRGGFICCAGLMLALAFAGSVRAQHLSWGVKAGATLTDIFSRGGIDEANKVIIGPMLDLRLPLIGFEADALYHNVTFTPASGSGRSNGGSFQFPIVAKLRAPAPLIKPYGEAGIAFRAFTGSASGLSSQSKKGFVIGAGIDVHAIVLHISPEIRFTHWGSASASILQANQNQFEFLVGFSR
jgi:hypothetical protein